MHNRSLTTRLKNQEPTIGATAEAWQGDGSSCVQVWGLECDDRAHKVAGKNQLLRAALWPSSSQGLDCICVCSHVHTHTHTYTYSHTHIYVSIYVYSHIQLLKYTHTYTHWHAWQFGHIKHQYCISLCHVLPKILFLFLCSALTFVAVILVKVVAAEKSLGIVTYPNWLQPPFWLLLVSYLCLPHASENGGYRLSQQQRQQEEH